MSADRFWIHDRDDQGRPIDQTLVKAAREAAPTLTRYRQQEINCESTTNRILQSAVEAASRAKRSRPIDSPIAYLTFVYKRLVDRFLHRQSKVVPVETSFLESLANSTLGVSFEEAIHNRLVLEKVLRFMDPNTREICNWRLQGYSMDEIATELGITRNCLSRRYIRGTTKAVRRMMLQRNPRANNDAKQEAV